MELQLNQPAWLTLRSPDGLTEAKIDVYKARRLLEEAEKQPSEELRWKVIIKFLGEQLNVNGDTLAESSAIEFHECINRAVIALNDERKKRLSNIASLPDSTPASQTTSEPGQ